MCNVIARARPRFLFFPPETPFLTLKGRVEWVLKGQVEWVLKGWVGRVLKGRVGRVPGCDQSGCDPALSFLGRKDMKLGNVPIEDKSDPISSAAALCVGAAPLTRLPSCSPTENVNSPLLLIPRKLVPNWSLDFPVLRVENPKENFLSRVSPAGARVVIRCVRALSKTASKPGCII